MVEIKPDKKIIHVNELGLSPNTCVREVLSAMPELLDRSSADIFSNFNIQVDGKDAGKSRDVVLMQTKIVEVDVIEVSTSPTVSEQKNGEGGVINIKLKAIDKEGLSGSVLVDANTSWDFQPSVLLNYKKGKFTLRSSVMTEYFQPTEYVDGLKEMPMQKAQINDTTRTKFGQETAKLQLQWNPTERDEITIYTWETFGMAHQQTRSGEVLWINQVTDANPQWNESRTGTVCDMHQRQLKAEGQVSYKHTYIRGGELKIEADYNYVPDLQRSQYNRYDADPFPARVGVDDKWKTDLDQHTHQVFGEISSKHVLLKPDSPHHLDMKIGANVTYDFGEGREIIADNRHIDTTYTREGNLHASPFLEWNYDYNGWYIQLGARYQYFRYGQPLGNDYVYVDNHTWLGNLSVMWQVKEHHNLRFVAARNVVWNKMVEEQKISFAANPYYNAELNYIFDWNNGEDYVMTNVGAKYVYAQRSDGYMGLIAGNAQLMYRHGIFSMAFAGNLYVKEEILYAGNIRDKWRFFYNLSLTPVLSFRKNWTLSAKLLYNSEVIMSDAVYGDCFYAQIRVSKDIKNWNVHLQLNDIFDYDTYNVAHENDWTVSTLTDMYPRSVQIGFGYKF